MAVSFPAHYDELFTIVASQLNKIPAAAVRNVTADTKSPENGLRALLVFSTAASVTATGALASVGDGSGAGRD